MATSQILRSAGFTKTPKILISQEQNIIKNINKKIHSLHIKRYVMRNNSFVADVTFKYVVLIITQGRV